MNSLKITIIGVISKIIPFITFPILSKIFAVGEIGQLDLILTTVIMVTTVAVIGQDSSLIRYFNVDNNEKRRIILVTSIVTTSLLSSVIIWLIYTTITLIFKNINFLGINISNTWILFLIVGFALTSIVDSLLRSLGNIKLYIKYTLMYNIILNLPVLWLYLNQNRSIEKYLIYYSICVLFSGIISLLYVNKYIVLSKIQICARKLIKYGWPMMLVSSIGLMQPLIERVLIKVMISDLELGLYSVSLKLMMLVQLPFTLFSNAVLVEIIKLNSKKDGREEIKKLINLYIYISLIIFTVFIILIDYIVLIMYDHQYLVAANFATMLALGIYIYNVGGILSSGLIIAEKTQYKLTSAMIAILLSIGISYLLVPSLGVIAIPFAYILSKIASILFEIKYSFMYCQNILINWKDVNILWISVVILSIMVMWKLSSNY